MGGGVYSFVACFSHLTVDHESLSRRSTVPTSSRDTSNIWALISVGFFHKFHENSLLILCPSSLAIFVHYLSPGNDSVLASVWSTEPSMPRSSISSPPPPTHPVPPCLSNSHYVRYLVL